MKNSTDTIAWAQGYQVLAEGFRELDEQLTILKASLDRLALFIQFLDKIFPEFCEQDQTRLKTLVSTFVESFEGGNEK